MKNILFKVIEIVGITLGIIVICIYIMLSTYIKGYFSAELSVQEVFR